jgi:hypothetical protein
VASTASAAVTASKARAFHYDLALTITEGSMTTKSAFALDVAEGHPATARLGKNVTIENTNNRSDVGSKVKGNLTMDGDVPKLDIDAEISALDSANKVFKLAQKGTAATPVGKATTVLDTTDGGRHVTLTATPTAAPEIGGEAKATGTATLDIVAAHAGGAQPKSTTLSAAITGDAPAVASKIDTAPLQVVDGGVASPRLDTGTRVKVTVEGHSGGMALDFNVEMSDVEPSSTPAMRIRKITSSGRALVPWEQPTQLLTADEDANRYSVTVTLHRPK